MHHHHTTRCCTRSRLDTVSPCVTSSLGGKASLGGKHLTLTGSGGIYILFDTYVTGGAGAVPPVDDAACTAFTNYVAGLNLNECADSPYGCASGGAQALAPPPPRGLQPANLQRWAALASGKPSAGQQAKLASVAPAATGDKPADKNNKAKTAYGGGDDVHAPAAPVFKADAVQLLSGTFEVVGQGSQVFSSGYLKWVFQQYGVSPVPAVGPVVGSVFPPYSIEYRFFTGAEYY